MKKLMMVAAMLALALALAIPAIAQVSGGGGNEAESDDVELGADIANEGNYAAQCVPVQQFGNTGNFNNAPNFTQYASESDDFQPGGIEFTVEPETSTECDQARQQSSAASS